METGADIPTLNQPALVPIASARSDAFAIVAIILIVIVLALLLAWPWLPQSNPQLVARSRYQPLAHGQATTRLTLDGEDTPLAWTTDNVLSIPAWEIFGEGFPALLQTQLLTLLPTLSETGRFPTGTSLFRSHSRTIDRDGIVTTSDTYILRQPNRDLVIAVAFPGIDLPLLYDPPLALTLNLEGDTTLEQSGNFAGIYTYTLTTGQSQVDDVASPFGEWRDCRQLKSTLTFEIATEIVAQEITTGDYCPNIGFVAQTSQDADGNVTSFSYGLLDLAANDPLTISAFLPPRQPLTTTVEPVTTIENWIPTDFAKSTQPDRATPNSIAPVYVTASSPYLLAATRGGPLVAIDAQQPDTALWQFQSAGSIYSPPAIDPATGYLYFGSSDKHLYALTSDGLFLWRVPTNDNIAAQPLILHNMVVVAVEDGSIYALDKITGAERWHVTLSSVSIAAPAHFPSAQEGLIVVGSDEGVVKTLDSVNGNTLWEVELDGAIQAPLRVDNGTLYVETVAAGIHAISPDGTLLWSADMLTPLRTAPTFDNEHLYVVDTLGWLYIIARDDGHTIWRSNRAGYLGPPIPLTTGDEGEVLLVAAMDGTVSGFSPLGDLLRQWHITDLETEQGLSPVTFSLGPTFGGGAIWLGDNRGEIVRLGPPIAAP